MIVTRNWRCSDREETESSDGAIYAPKMLEVSWPFTTEPRKFTYVFPSRSPTEISFGSTPQWNLKEKRRSDAGMNGDLQKALELSLREHEERERRERGRREENDRAFALALQGQDSPSTAVRTGGFSLWNGRAASDLCASCNKPLTRSYIETNGRKYHNECFRCAGCHDLIRDTYTMHENAMFHSRCFEELFGKKCSVCKSCIRGMYMKHNFFSDEIYCQAHGNDSKINRCFSCSRKEPLASKEKYVSLPDGRFSCMECISTAIFDSEELVPLKDKIFRFFIEKLHMTLPVEIYNVPILAVDLTCLNERKIEIGSHNQPICRGLTLSSVGEIKHVQQSGIVINHHGQVVLKPPTIHRIEQIRDVTAVLVLTGLPYKLTLSILAHELFHAYIKLTKTFPLKIDSQCEEGLCQWIADAVLTFDMNNDRDNIPLNKYFKYSIETDPSDVYGEGYRKAAIAVNNLGLSITLEYVAESGKLPRV